MNSNFALINSYKILRRGGSSIKNYNYKTNNSYKVTKYKNFRYLIIKYQTKFLYLKLEKFISKEKKS